MNIMEEKTESTHITIMTETHDGQKYIDYMEDCLNNRLLETN